LLAAAPAASAWHRSLAARIRQRSPGLSSMAATKAPSSGGCGARQRLLAPLHLCRHLLALACSRALRA